MITDQPVNNHDDMHKVTDNMLREVGLTIDDCGGKVTFAVSVRQKHAWRGS